MKHADQALTIWKGGFPSRRKPNSSIHIPYVSLENDNDSYILHNLESSPNTASLTTHLANLYNGNKATPWTRFIQVQHMYLLNQLHLFKITSRSDLRGHIPWKWNKSSLQRSGASLLAWKVQSHLAGNFILTRWMYNYIFTVLQPWEQKSPTSSFKPNQARENFCKNHSGSKIACITNQTLYLINKNHKNL